MHSLVLAKADDGELAALTLDPRTSADVEHVIDLNPRDDDGKPIDGTATSFVQLIHRGLLAASTIPEFEHCIYKHQPLGDCEKPIRLLALMPGDKTKAISASSLLYPWTKVFLMKLCPTHGALSGS